MFATRRHGNILDEGALVKTISRVGPGSRQLPPTGRFKCRAERTEPDHGGEDPPLRRPPETDERYELRPPTARGTFAPDTFMPPPNCWGRRARVIVTMFAHMCANVSVYVRVKRTPAAVELG